MTLLAVGLAALAAWLAVGPRQRLPRPGPSGPPSTRRPAVVLRTVVLVLVLGGVVVGCARVGGPGAAALATALGIAGLSAAHLGSRQLRTRTVVRRRREVARAASSLAVQLQAGLVATDALQNAALDWSVLRHGAAAQRLGGDPTDVWLEDGGRPGLSGLTTLARGWRLCVRSGAPLAPTLQQVADTLQVEETLGLTVTAELAAPRATGRIMAVLPLVGLALGFAMGGDPIRFLLDTWPGRGCLVGGAVLAALGVAWIESIAGRVANQL